MVSPSISDSSHVFAFKQGVRPRRFDGNKSSENIPRFTIKITINLRKIQQVIKVFHFPGRRRTEPQRVSVFPIRCHFAD